MRSQITQSTALLFDHFVRQVLPCLDKFLNRIYLLSLWFLDTVDFHWNFFHLNRFILALLDWYCTLSTNHKGLICCT